MTNPLTDPGGTGQVWPPSELAGNKTSAFGDPVQHHDADWRDDLGNQNDVQPGLKPGNGWKTRPHLPADGS